MPFESIQSCSTTRLYTSSDPGANRNVSFIAESSFSRLLNYHEFSKKLTSQQPWKSVKKIVMRLLLSAVLILWQANFSAFAQQISGALLPLDLLDLSDGCLAAVNNTITTCPRWLPKHVDTGYCILPRYSVKNY
jgi:hypothetical protein